MKQFIALFLVGLLAGCTDATSTETTESETATEGAEMVAMEFNVSAIRETPIDTHAFDVATINISQGANVTLHFYNNDSNPFVSHDFVIDALNVTTGIIAPGEMVTINFIADLEVGEYVFYCSVGKHRDAGMEGTLVIA